METEKDRIVKIMEAEGLNATQFANEIGIKSPTLSHILNGRNNPSLDVLKRILETYRTISSDWLILGVGTMHRGIKQPQPLSLFDDMDETERKSDRYDVEREQKTVHHDASNQRKMDETTSEVAKIDTTLPPVSKLVEKIIVYYDDNTFQEFAAKK